jgi:hypothetical protein
VAPELEVGGLAGRKRCGSRVRYWSSKIEDGVQDKTTKRLDVYVDFAFHFHSFLSALQLYVGC